jgi:hypothetical protein
VLGSDPLRGSPFGALNNTIARRISATVLVKRPIGNRTIVATQKPLAIER